MTRNKEKLILLGVIGLSLISVTAGFNFYHTLFGMAIAILCTLIFETLRVACLWSLVVEGWLLGKIIAVPIYSLTAITCAFAAITSFHAEIIASHATAMKPVEEEIGRRIELVKRAYVTTIGEEIGRLDERIDQCKRKLALNPESHYWKNRLIQLDGERQLMIANRDSFLSVIPQQGREAWLSSQAALLGLEFEPLPQPAHGSIAFSQAIQELWGISELAGKKAVSIIIVLTTELGIVLLSLLAQGRVIMADSRQKLLKELRKKFEDTEIRAFVAKCAESLEKKQRLPYMRELGKHQREVRRHIIRNGSTEQEIMELVLQRHER